MLKENKLFSYRCRYLEDALTYEESRSMGLQGFHEYVEKHIFPIPKDELVAGQEYHGWSRDARSARWDGKVFHYITHKFGSIYDFTLPHYEDVNYDEYGMDYDMFVPIKEV